VAQNSNLFNIGSGNKTEKKPSRLQSSNKSKERDKIAAANVAYPLDAKIESKNDPFKSSNEIKRTFYVGDSDVFHFNNNAQAAGGRKMDTSAKLLMDYRNMNQRLADMDNQVDVQSKFSNYSRKQK